MAEKEGHYLVPKHQKLSEKEKKELFETYNISLKELPKILKTDPSIEELSLLEGDVVKVFRSSPTRGKSIYYRGVTNG